ncbi:acyl-CoA dehydrogenase [Streptomyces sp. NPDC002004]
MGIGITREQRELAEAVRGWIARTVPPEEVRKLLDAPTGPVGRPPHWDGLAEQGLLAVHLPEMYGGGGGDLVDLAVVVEEAARAVLPGPYLASALASTVLAHAGTGRESDPGVGGLVRALASGERIGAVALGAGSLTAVAGPDGCVLDGTAPPVLSGAEADLLILTARTAHGPLLAAVDAADLTVRAHDSADPTRPTAEVTAHGVRVPADRVLDVTPGLVRDLAAVLHSADACGTAARALHTATEYAKVREQFGRPIGRFQAVKHMCAEMLVSLEQARALTWDAARTARAVADRPSVPRDGRPGHAPRDGGPLDAPREGHPPAAPTDADLPPAPEGARGLVTALAAGTAIETAVTCARQCIQILGGIGFTWEHDAHLYLRRALVARQLLGPADGHLQRAVGHAASGARRELRMDVPEEEAAPYRRAAREVIEAARGLAPDAARRELAATGYAAPHLPRPHGLGAGPVQQLVVQQELRAAGVRLSDLGIATWVVPSLIAYGTQAQRDRYLLPTLRGDLLWCQLFSEPGAGSDLASLRTRAERLPDGRWRINGQKVWTSAAQWADHGILLARTDPDAPKHRGLTYFVVDMKDRNGAPPPGLDIRPLKEITGESLFNEVYFDDLVLPADAVVGAVDDGWRVARNTLGDERVHMADQLTFDTGLESLIARAQDLDGTRRARIGALAAEAHALGCIALRTTTQQVSGLEPGAGAAVRKLLQTAHQQKVADLALELLGPAGAVREGAGERALHGFLLSRCLTIAGGTTQVQLNVVAERVLGLPRD